MTQMPTAKFFLKVEQMLFISHNYGYTVNFFQDEMNTVVAGIEKPIRAKKIRELFDMLLANFDADGDGRLSLAEFTDSMKGMKF